MSDSFSILAVCTGNLCRSPLAEQLLSDTFWDVPEISVSSVGTQAVPGQLMAAHSLDIALAMGATSAVTHRARRITDKILESSDLILAMTREHRRIIVERAPRVTRRVFAVRELARLAAATSDRDLIAEIGKLPAPPVARLQAAVRAATYGRSQIEPLADPADEDVIDPYPHGLSTYVISARQLTPAVEATAVLLRRSLEVTSP